MFRFFCCRLAAHIKNHALFGQPFCSPTMTPPIKKRQALSSSSALVASSSKRCTSSTATLRSASSAATSTLWSASSAATLRTPSASRACSSAAVAVTDSQARIATCIIASYYIVLFSYVFYHVKCRRGYGNTYIASRYEYSDPK
jgi:hypothetical protein